MVAVFLPELLFIPKLACLSFAVTILLKSDNGRLRSPFLVAKRTSFDRTAWARLSLQKAFGCCGLMGGSVHSELPFSSVTGGSCVSIFYIWERFMGMSTAALRSHCYALRGVLGEQGRQVLACLLWLTVVWGCGTVVWGCGNDCGMIMMMVSWLSSGHDHKIEGYDKIAR
jgi:hypothetical protein